MAGGGGGDGVTCRPSAAPRRHRGPPCRSELVMNLDDVIPNPQYQICHSRVARAPLPAVWDAVHRVTMSALPLGHALEGVRVLPARLSGKKLEPLAGRTFLDVTPIPVLFSERPHVVISAGLSQAWRLLGGSTPPVLDAAGLRDLVGTGWLKGRVGVRPGTTPHGQLLRYQTRHYAL